jgi:predicted dehydrogenase
MSDDLSRREFLRLSTGTLALGVLPQFNLTRSPGVAVIGAGQQGVRLLRGLWSLPSGVRVLGVYDVWDTALQNAAQLARTAGKPLRVTHDEAELWSWTDVQAVLIATPDFSHTPLALAALNAGKSVYLETPLTRTLTEMRVLQEAALSQQLALYSGDFNGRHPRYQLAAGLVRSGMLGKIHRIHIAVHSPPATSATAEVNSSAVQWEAFLQYLSIRAFNADFFVRWQKHRETSYGAALTQLAAKIAIVQQILGVSQPTRVTAHGGVYVASDQPTTPDTFYAVLDYAEGFVVSFSALVGDAVHDSFTLHGTHGTLDIQHGTLTADHAVAKPIPAWLAQQVTQQLQQSALTEPDLLAMHLTDWLHNLQRPQAWLAHWEQAQHIVATTERAAAHYFT